MSKSEKIPEAMMRAKKKKKEGGELIRGYLVIANV